MLFREGLAASRGGEGRLLPKADLHVSQTVAASRHDTTGTTILVKAALTREGNERGRGCHAHRHSDETGLRHLCGGKRYAATPGRLTRRPPPHSAAAFWPPT